MLPSKVGFGEIAGQLAGLEQIGLLCLGLVIHVGHGGHERVPIIHQDQTIGRQVVEQGGWVGIEKGQIELDAAKVGALFEVGLVLPVFHASGRVAGDDIQIGTPLGRYRRQPRQRLCGRRQGELVDEVQGALCRRVKDAQAVDLVTKKLNTHRQGLIGIARIEIQDIGWKDVDQPAPPAKGPRLLDDGFGAVAMRDPTARHPLEVHLLAATILAQAHAELANRQGLVHERPCRGDDEWGSRG